MGKRRQYSDEERAEACALLEANGYPEVKGAMAKTSRIVDIPPATLRGWFTEQNNPPPTELRDRKRMDLKSAIDAELDAIFEAMRTKRKEASYRDLTTAAGIFADKKILLDGGLTSNDEMTIRVVYDEK